MRNPAGLTSSQLSQRRNGKWVYQVHHVGGDPRFVNVEKLEIVSAAQNRGRYNMMASEHLLYEVGYKGQPKTVATYLKARRLAKAPLK